jgi:carbon-monoxide dehydrogenase medium subunit
MLSHEFAFHAPTTLDEALGLLETHAESAKALAGGMSMVPAMNLGILRPEVVVSLNHVAGLDAIADEGDTIRIGAMVRHERVAVDPAVRASVPLLAEAARRIGDVQIRHRGTIGGSAAHADPAADYLPVLLLLGAEVVLASSSGRRTVAARDFFVDIMRTSIEPGELLVELLVPKVPARGGSAYVRLHRVEGSFAIVNAAAVVTNGSARIAIGGSTPTPAIAEPGVDLSGGLTDAASQTIADAAFAACEDAYGDLNGSADYRRAMARVYAVRAVASALAARG